MVRMIDWLSWNAVGVRSATWLMVVREVSAVQGAYHECGRRLTLLSKR